MMIIIIIDLNQSKAKNLESWNFKLKLENENLNTTGLCWRCWVYCVDMRVQTKQKSAANVCSGGAQRLGRVNQTYTWSHKVKSKVDDTWYSASLWANPITEAFRYGTRFQGSHSFTCHPHVYPSALPAEAGHHLPSPKGWRAELA